MMEVRAASEKIVTAENDSKTSPVYEGSSTANVKVETQLKSEILLDATYEELEVGCNIQNDEPGDIKCTVEKIVKPVVEKDREVQVGCNEDKTTSAGRGSETEENPLVGKVKIKPMASLVETNAPNSNPGVHPFFAGFDEHIRSLIMNRQPQFPLAPLIQRPVKFMYYDNSTNMNLKKMLNGNNMTQIPVSRPSFRPYVPINVPRPPRSLASMRTSFSTQTPPMFSESLDVPAEPATSYQCLLQSRSPLPTLSSLPNFPASPKKLSWSNFTPANNLSMPDIRMPKNVIVGNASQKPNKVSTSSSTDDLETSEDKEIIKTEVDLENESKDELLVGFGTSEVDLENHLNEELPDKFRPSEVDLESGSKEEPAEIDLENDSNEAIMNACNNSGTHFIDAPNVDTCEVKPELLTLEQPLIMTGDALLTPPSRGAKKNPIYELPTYSTKGSLLCKCCDFRCNKMSKMKEHLEEMHTAENNFKCFYCIKNLSPRLYHKTLSALEYHVAKVHRGEKRWRCKGCSKSYKSRASYEAHVEKMCSKLRPYACHKCTFTCMTEAALVKHLKSHETILETRQCPFCNKSLKKFYLKQHLLTVHAPPEEKPFHCMICNLGFGTQIAMENHYKKTRHDKKFKCDQCNYAARDKQGIKQHIEVVHLKLGVGNFVCGVNGCEVTTYSIGNLINHRKIHSNPESELLTCPEPECLKKFTTHNGLRIHTLKTQHHKPHKCSDCSARFLKESVLGRHIQNIHVTRIMKKMEKGDQEPMCIKNVVDVFAGLGARDDRTSEISGEDVLANFGGWLGISGDITNMADNLAPAVTESRIETESQVTDTEVGDDDEYENVVPVTCLVEVKDEEMYGSFVGEEEDGETLGSVKVEKYDMGDSEYHHITPEACLVERQHNSTMDMSTSSDYHENEQQETERVAANSIKVEVEDS